MHFQPDIMVTESDGAQVSKRLVVEVKLQVPDLAAEESMIRRHLFANAWPVGMLVTADALRIYRDTHTAGSPLTIERAGEYPLGDALDLCRSPGLVDGRWTGSQVDLAVAMQAWLSTLSDPSVQERLPEPLRADIKRFVVPELAGAEIGAGVPRWLLTGSG